MRDYEGTAFELIEQLKVKQEQELVERVALAAGAHRAGSTPLRVRIASHLSVDWCKH